MFKLTQTPAYWWPVTVRQPSIDKPGELVDAKFEVEFLWLDDDAHDALMVTVNAERQRDRDFVPHVVRSVRQVADEDGNELPFTPELFAQMLKTTGVATAIAKQYFVSRSEAAEKN
jgi:hypothetical protein